MTSEAAPVRDRGVRVPSESTDRLPGPDVVRACALIGVVVMNYHGYLIIRGATPGDGWAARLLDPWEGVLSTRFAATFVLMAGVGVTLLTRRVVADRTAGRAGADARLVEMRWRLVRRGIALYVLGQLLDIIWPGTIILYYGAMFALASLLFTLRTRWIVATGILAAGAGWGLHAWTVRRQLDGGSVQWLLDPGADSVRALVFEVFVNGTHPLLPWLAFFCAGIVLGRYLDRERLDLVCIAVGLGLVGSTMVGRGFAGATVMQQEVLSLRPLDRGGLYVASALGTALLAFGIISRIVTRLDGVAPGAIDPLRRAGQMTLTIYIAHILVFDLLVDWWGWVEPAGVATALGFALVFWIVAIAAGALWHRRFGSGPAERVYRHLGA